MAIYEDVQYLINAAAVDLGLDPVTDVLSSTNSAFAQLRYLADSAGQELLMMHQWTEFEKEHSITTDAADSGDYTLPTDFASMIPQTNWDRSNNLPMQGPLTAQDWQYLKGRELINQTVYASFRLKQGKFHVFPDNPVPDAMDIRFEYLRNTWLVKVDEATTLYTKINANTDIVMFPPIVFKHLVRVKFLEAKGFESSKARDDFNDAFEAATGRDGSASVLNAGNGSGYPYLDIFRNTPDTNYGLS